MKFLFYSLAAFLFVTASCNTRPQDETKAGNELLVGKWHRFSMENGYSEFDIDSEYVVFYNHKVGRFKLPYHIENDSIKYLTHPYAAKIISFGDSVLLKGNDSTTAVLYRFRKEEGPFTAIPEERDSALFAAYIKGFDQRLVKEFEKAGIEIADQAQKTDDATYLQLLKKKNQ